MNWNPIITNQRVQYINPRLSYNCSPTINNITNDTNKNQLNPPARVAMSSIPVATSILFFFSFLLRMRNTWLPQLPPVPDSSMSKSKICLPSHRVCLWYSQNPVQGVNCADLVTNIQLSRNLQGWGCDLLASGQELSAEVQSQSNPKTSFYCTSLGCFFQQGGFKHCPSRIQPCIRNEVFHIRCPLGGAWHCHMSYSSCRVTKPSLQGVCHWVLFCMVHSCS